MFYMPISPTVISGLIADVLNRGVSREEVMLRVKLSKGHLSNLEAGRSYLHDSKLPLLADLHGGYSSEQIRAMKHLEKLERDKGIPRHIMQSVLFMRPA